MAFYSEEEVRVGETGPLAALNPVGIGARDNPKPR
jgi:hypothetical protein